MPEATVSNADLLKPEVIRNEMVETVDQMERINMGDGGQYASAMSEFPLVNLDDPTESYYTFDGVTGRMRPTAYDAESPIGAIDLPSKEEVTIASYKKKYNPNKGTETALRNVPFSAFARGVSLLRQKIFLTREQIAWRGDESVDGLIGQYGTSPHPEIPSSNQPTIGTAWSDATNATPYDDITQTAFDLVNNGYMGGNTQVMPNLYVGPSTLRDLKQTDDMQGRLPDTSYQQVTNEAVNAMISDDIANVLPVMVFVPREDANGNYIDSNGNIVEDADDAARDNILEPYDPSGDAVVRNAVLARPGAGSAYFPWFLDRLLEYQGEVPGEMSVDRQNGFFTQVWNSPDPVATYMAGKQEIGFEVRRGENFAVLSGV